jgi:excinuclease ABC subunit B
MKEINTCVNRNERVLVTTLTKRMAEDLTAYLSRYGIKCQYIHSDVDTIERVKILENLRLGAFDVLIGVNLLREGLDLPEVSLVAILDADKEGFLRSERSLTQTAGRAARNINGKVIMYADKITDSMQRTIDETNRRREKQMAYNIKHGITPQQIVKTTLSSITTTMVQPEPKAYVEKTSVDYAADPVVQYLNPAALKKLIEKTRKEMEAAARQLDFLEAARLRDELFALEKIYKEKTSKTTR